MRVIDGVLRWGAVSNERALSNARQAATECSRRAVERAEVEAFLASHATVYGGACGGANGAAVLGRAHEADPA